MNWKLHFLKFQLIVLLVQTLWLQHNVVGGVSDYIFDWSQGTQETTSGVKCN